MEFRILGPLEVWEGGRQIEVVGTRQRALLAILLTRANQVVSRDRLVDELFDEESRETADGLVRVYVSRLRKALAATGEHTSRVVTRTPGYLLRVESGELDLQRFEQLAEEGRQALRAGDPDVAVAMLSEALGLWRGSPLADFAYRPFAQAEIGRLEELRLATIEDRIEADLALGRHSAVVSELEKLVAEHPLREQLRARLMLALYRAGRQADALAVYQATRQVLVEQLGLEPSAELQQLEKAILRHDPSLDLAPGQRPLAAPAPAIVVAACTTAGLDLLMDLAKPLCRTEPMRELILSLLVGSVDELAAGAADVHARREELRAGGLVARAAAFTSEEPAADLHRVVAKHQTDLVLFDASRDVDPIRAAEPLMADSPCDVALLAGAPSEFALPDPRHPVVVPFGGAEHDWGALELGAWLAIGHGAPLRIVGPLAEPERGKRDASRLLARASLIVQGFAGIPAEPVLSPTGVDGVLAAAAGAGVLVVGVSGRWRGEGIGTARAEIARRAPAPVLLLRRGLRPGGLAPTESASRFTWSMAGV